MHRILHNLILVLAIGLSSAAAAQGVPIGALPSATTPLSGAEYTILSQAGTTVKAPVSAFGTPLLTIAANTILGNNTASGAVATGLTVSQVNTMLGLGTAAFQNVGTSGANLPFLSGTNTWSGVQTFSAGISLSSLTVNSLTVTGSASLPATTISGALSGAGSISGLPISGSTGSFTTLAASSTVSGAGFTAYLASPPAIGGTSPAAGTFTTFGANTSFTLNGSGTITAVAGTDTKLLSASGAFTNGNLIVGDAQGGAQDGGTIASNAVSSLSLGSTGLTPSVATKGAVTVAGTLAVANGGTGQTTYTNGQLLIGNTTGNTLAKATLSAGTGISITNGTGTISIATTGIATAWGSGQTVGFTAVSNTAYCIDTLTTGAVTMTLPASPADGDVVQATDCKSNFATANLTVGRNGKSLMGLAQDMTVNTNNASFVLRYWASTTDWRLQ